MMQITQLPYHCCKYLYDSCVDQSHPWKKTRYQVGLNQWVHSIGGEAIFALSEITLKQEEIIYQEKIRSSFAILQKFIQDPWHHPRNAKQTFIKELRVCILSMSELNEKPIIYQSITQVCQKIFTDVHLLSYLTILVKFISSKGDNNLPPLNEKMTLLEFLNAVRHRIQQCPLEYLSPTLSINASKLKKMTRYFDPLGSTNLPWLYEIVKQKCGKTLLHYRTGVPICPQETSPFVRVVPELLAFIDGLKSENKKLAIFLHLDPLYLDTQSANLKIFEGLTKNLVDPFKQNEAIWSSLIIALEKRYPENLEVFLFPLDGAQLKTLVSGKKITEFRDDLMDDMIEGKKALFYFSSRVPISQRISLTNQAFEEIQDQYFSQIDKEGLLTVEESKAFYVLFCARLKDLLVIERKIDMTQANCTDGVDRTSVFVLAQLLMHSHLLGKKIDRDELAGLLFGPALAIWKRAVMRWDYMEALMGYFEKHQERLSDQKILLHELTDFSLPKHFYQPVLPPLSLYKDKQKAISAFFEEIEMQNAKSTKHIINHIFQNLLGKQLTQNQLDRQLVLIGEKKMDVQFVEDVETVLIEQLRLDPNDTRLPFLKLALIPSIARKGEQKIIERYLCEATSFSSLLKHRTKILKNRQGDCVVKIVQKVLIQIHQDSLVDTLVQLTLKHEILLPEIGEVSSWMMWNIEKNEPIIF